MEQECARGEAGMKTIILNILCEGQTEELFVKKVLKPHLLSRGIVVKHRLLVTSKKKNAKGGIISYRQAKGDLCNWMKEVASHNSETHYFTTMFDYYALPDDFPGNEQPLSIIDAYTRVDRIERAFARDIDKENFIPYIQLHEFEALLFCDMEKLVCDYPDCKKELVRLSSILDEYNGNPELIDNSPETAPSKRIIKAIEGERKYHYNKPRSGSDAAAAIGISELTRQCRHFGNWITKLERISQ